MKNLGGVLTLFLLLGLGFYLYTQFQGSQEKFSTSFDENITFDLELDWNGKDKDYTKTIKIKKESIEQKIENKSPVRELSVYIDTYPINGQLTKLIFIYDLYLGWTILNYKDLEVWKSYTELPTDKELLVKLRLLEHPILEFKGDSFEKHQH